MWGNSQYLMQITRSGRKKSPFCLYLL